MRKLTLLLAIGLSGAVSVASAALQEVHLDLTWRTTQYAKIVDNVLTVDVPASASNGTWSASATVDLTPFDGKVLVAEIDIAGENVSHNPTSYFGIKFMLHYTDPKTGIQHWPQAQRDEGTFARRKFQFTEYQTEGSRGTSGSLMLGFQQGCGKAVFDLSTLKFYIGDDMWPQMPWAPRTNEDYVVSYPVHVTNGPPLRGVMLPSANCKEDDFRTLAEWGATLGRYQMTSGPTPNAGESPSAYLERYDAWLDQKLDHLDREALPWANRYGIKLVVDLHSPPGGRMTGSNDFRLFDEAVYKDRFLQIWRDIATRFKGRTGIYGYDLYNEPYQTKATTWDYWTLQKTAAEEIRAIDPDATIIIESSSMDAAQAYAYLSPLAMDNVIYQFHFYTPGEFTHQGVNSNTNTNRYPDATKGWDREFLKRQMDPVRRFELLHHAKIYVGEFSAIAWGEGSAQYIADCISIFNEYGWDWTYHAFREWTGWSVEHETPRGGSARASEDNPRKRALLAGLRQNDGYGATAETTADDTFETASVGVTAMQLHNGWEGGGVVASAAYTPPTPPGYPRPDATHTQVFDVTLAEVERDISSTNAANRTLDMMLRVSKGTPLSTPKENVRCLISINEAGRFCLWHDALGEGGVRQPTWTELAPTAYREGDWVRLGIETAESTSTGELHCRIRLDGSCCPTAQGVRSPDDPTPYGAWYRCLGPARTPLTRIGFSDTMVDDFRATAETVPSAHTGATSTNGLAFSWFDRWGLPRRPDAAAPFIPGYSLADVYRTGVHPYSAEPFRVTDIAFDAEGRLNLTVNGYKDESAQGGYEILHASTPDGLGRPPEMKLKGGEVIGDPATWSSTWRGAPPPGDASVFRVRGN